MDANKLRTYGKDMVEMVAQYWEHIEDWPVLSTIKPLSIIKQIPTDAPELPETWEDIKKDIFNIIMPGITHWHSPRFNAYFPAGNSYPAICADILCDGLGVIGFSWISSPACTELEIAMMNWLGRLLKLPEEFLYGPNSKGGGVIQGSASESTYIALLAAKARAMKRYQESHYQQRQPLQEDDLMSGPEVLLLEQPQPENGQQQQQLHESLQPLPQQPLQEQFPVHQEQFQGPQSMHNHSPPSPSHQENIIKRMTYGIDLVGKDPQNSKLMVVAPYCTVVQQALVRSKYGTEQACTDSVPDTSSEATSTSGQSATPANTLPEICLCTVTTVSPKNQNDSRNTTPFTDNRPFQITSSAFPNTIPYQRTPAVPTNYTSLENCPYAQTTPLHGIDKCQRTTYVSNDNSSPESGTPMSNPFPSTGKCRQRYPQSPTTCLPPELIPPMTNPSPSNGHEQRMTVIPPANPSPNTYSPLQGDTKCIHDRLVAYSSMEAHSSVERAGLLASVTVRLLPTDSQCSLRGATVAEAITNDKANGYMPFLIVATLGTTSSVAFDNLKELGRIAQREGMWLHIDAAYAGSAFICPEFRPMLDGVELADSFNFNPHKWLMVNFDCSAMWFKNSDELTMTFEVNPKYLSHQAQGMVPDFRHWQIPLGRRFRSLKLWFTLRMLGAKALRKHIITQVNLAREFHRHMMQDPNFEFIGDNNLGVICFRIKGSNELNERLYNIINQAGKIHITKADIHTVPQLTILRFAICSPLTQLQHVLDAWHEICHHASQLIRSIKCPKS